MSLLPAAIPVIPATAVPPNTGDGYVAGAYIVFFLIVLVYVAIMALRLTRLERNVRELRTRGEGLRPEEPRAQAQPTRESAQESEQERTTA
ncbi:MAG TPA: hypothetical protein VL972_01425 [Solirubrobacteraceae bacterium]|nr:hypothetical protein [Solirubrobacteraceae bacterium]